MNKIRDRRNIIIICLTICILIMSSYYVVFAKTTKTKTNWNVEFTKINQIENKNIESVDTLFKDTKLSLDIKFKSSNSSLTYQLYVKNKGNLKAKLEEIVKTINPNLEVDIYDIEKGFILNPNEEKKFLVSVKPTNNMQQNTKESFFVTLLFSEYIS